MFGKELAYGIAKHLEAEPTEKDLASMTYGYNIDLDYGLYTRKTREMRRRERKRQKELEKEKEAAMQLNDGESGMDDSLGIRISVDSSMGRSSVATFKDPLNKDGGGTEKKKKERSSSKQSSRSARQLLTTEKKKDKGALLNIPMEGNITQEKLILNQSQRDYYKKRVEHRESRMGEREVPAY